MHVLYAFVFSCLLTFICCVTSQHTLEPKIVVNKVSEIGGIVDGGGRVDLIGFGRYHGDTRGNNDVLGSNNDRGNNNGGGDEENEENDGQPLKCRCSSYCYPDEYIAATCSDWWRTLYCCQYRICGICRCGSSCEMEEVHKGYCNSSQVRCCQRCDKQTLIDSIET